MFIDCHPAFSKNVFICSSCNLPKVSWEQLKVLKKKKLPISDTDFICLLRNCPPRRRGKKWYDDYWKSFSGTSKSVEHNKCFSPSSLCYPCQHVHDRNINVDTTARFGGNIVSVPVFKYHCYEGCCAFDKVGWHFPVQSDKKKNTSNYSWRVGTWHLLPTQSFYWLLSLRA